MSLLQEGARGGLELMEQRAAALQAGHNVPAVLRDGRPATRGDLKAGTIEDIETRDLKEVPMVQLAE